MPEYLSPGVYVEEFEIGAKPMEGVSTSTAGFLGECERGPTRPHLITSWLQYQRVYGSYFGETKYLPGAVDGFFKNGGQRCYIGRIVKAGKDPATNASLKLKANGRNALTIEAVGEGNWGSRVAVKLSKGTFDGFKMSVFYWKEMPSSLYDPFIEPKVQPRPTTTEVFDNISVNEESPDYFEKTINGISSLIMISKKEGDSGNLPDSLEASSNVETKADENPNVDEKTIKDDKNKNEDKQKVSVKATEGTITIKYLEGGSDGGTIGLSDYERSSPEEDKPGKRRGMTAFNAIDDISIVYAPNAYAIPGLVGSLISNCENLKDRFAIIDAEQGFSNVSGLNPRSDTPTEYAAFYYPWIKVINPESGLLRPVPPGGYVAGIYARSDNERGIHKAPANEVVRGASDLEFQITKGEQDVLNPRGVNVIRAFPGRGICVWGARTLSSNTLWKYINVRRLFIFVESSIEQGTQWVVFEPNDEKLWARVRATITQFLTGLWRDGALMGTTAEEAFFVKCDRSTMTQDDIDNGRLICIIGIAPVKPAEFVIFRIAQWQGGSTATE
ncbi:phage tail sheath family protein [Methanolobus sp. ZRKC3]|uniref:phage tail sheath family protein n=1 Tax=Methanolobus sp. ZRKC3 TaxID=3125786 RepID=UPI0032445F56